jgi:hypothetical protein
MTRALLTAAVIGTLTGLALTFGPHGAIGVAVCAAGVLVWCLVAAVRRDKRRGQYVTYAQSGHDMDANFRMRRDLYLHAQQLREGRHR